MHLTHQNTRVSMKYYSHRQPMEINVYAKVNDLINLIELVLQQ